MVKAVEKGMRGAPEPGAPAPATGHSPRIPFLTAFTIDFLRFAGHFCCPVRVLRRDSFWGRVWYGNRLIYVIRTTECVYAGLYISSRAAS